MAQNYPKPALPIFTEFSITDQRDDIKMMRRRSLLTNKLPS